MLPKRVKIVEVGPRDGLQNEKAKIRSECLKRPLSTQLGNSGRDHLLRKRAAVD